MNKTLLIIRHEFINMIKRTGFIIMTLAIPVLALIAIGIFQIVSRVEKPPEEEVEIGYVDESAGVFSNYTQQGNITLINYQTRDMAKKALIDNDITEYFVVPSNYINTGIIDRYTLQRQIEVPAANANAIQNFLLSNLLHGESSLIIERVKAPLNIISTRLTETGSVAPEQGGVQTFIIPYLFSILLIMSIFFSSGYLLQGLGEEKENRIMEILLSSVSTRQLLTGKVLGLGAAGLLQILVWLVSASLLLNIASATIGGFISSIHIPFDFLIIGITYFILGYLLFAIISAGVGAVSPTAREGQQLSTIFTLVAIMPLYFMPLLITDPNNLVSVILTLFPLTAPVTVMVRMGLSDIAIWELAVSIILLMVAITGGLWLAAKIFRTYLLMFGKRPNLKDIIRNIRSI
jgi:ABC-2 type transport system permease protein